MSGATRQTASYVFRRQWRLMLKLAAFWGVIAVATGHVCAQNPASMPVQAGTTAQDVRIDSGLVTMSVFCAGISVTAVIVWRVASERQSMRDRLERLEHELRNIKQAMKAKELERKESRDEG